MPLSDRSVDPEASQATTAPPSTQERARKPTLGQVITVSADRGDATLERGAFDESTRKRSLRVRASTVLAGLDLSHPVDAVFVNAPLKDYDQYPRHNDYTLPVLGMAYIATYAADAGFNVGVLDAEAAGLGVSEVARIVNDARPRWVGVNLLAPTYRLSAAILSRLDPGIRVMVGGHQAKAMPAEILADPAIPRIDALILGEGELRVAALLADEVDRRQLPGVMWFNPLMSRAVTSSGTDTSQQWLAPDINRLPFVGREFLAEDPYQARDGRLEANMVGSRGCPYNCTFCGAAASANPDIDIRTRHPDNILAEMLDTTNRFGVTAFRFVDDLFLANPRFMRSCLALFKDHNVGDRFVWDATGRINVLSRASDDLLDLMHATGCREVALGIESGSGRLLRYMGKKITPEMTKRAVRRLTERGISVKGYFILGYPTETIDELDETITQIRRLWDITDTTAGSFRASAFEFRPYPGTPEWHRLVATHGYDPAALLDYEHVDLTAEGASEEMRTRDEFNFSVNLQFGEAPVRLVRERLAEIVTGQHQRNTAAEGQVP